jgi:hypothetical protein
MNKTENERKPDRTGLRRLVWTMIGAGSGGAAGFYIRGKMNESETIGLGNIFEQLVKVAVWTLVGAILGAPIGYWFGWWKTKPFQAPRTLPSPRN